MNLQVMNICLKFLEVTVYLPIKVPLQTLKKLITLENKNA